MRIAHLVVAASLAISAVLAGPAFARNADAQKGEDKSASSSPSCSAYQQAPDGSWEQLPCKETGERSQPQTQHKSGAQGTDQGER
ncbi:hypothetical protein [Bradyrhizobium sp.]|jgi:hypothetical protein|uniref:hypothetical protein n=1 Tax=Bradyrhizobium sp. TaxID=376 RepID=UPI002DDCE3DB|nr:hypothetical protein [Bradyrhizobium sp.]HEV2154997.1 hypothetical protein [Bradyrhizobium sp.]